MPTEIFKDLVQDSIALSFREGQSTCVLGYINSNLSLNLDIQI